MNEGWIALSPIVSIPSEHTRLPLLKLDLAAVAIVFDFRESSASLPAAIDQGRQLWLDESEFGGYAKHRALTEEARTVDCQGFFRSSKKERDDDGRETTISG